MSVRNYSMMPWGVSNVSVFNYALQNDVTQEFVQFLASVCFQRGESLSFHVAGFHQREDATFDRGIFRHGVFVCCFEQLVLVPHASGGSRGV